MIFVSVGMQMPFDRLCRTVDDWSESRQRDDVFMQIGSTSWRPRRCAFSELLEPDEYARRVEESTVLVMHAGIGSILAAMKHEKPIIVLPRTARLRETRNDHQIATARMFRKIGGITVAFDEHELVEKLESIDEVMKPSPLSPNASSELISALRSFIHAA